MTTIDNTNYELWLLRYAEGDLTAAECAAVEAWLESHPEAAEELALYHEAPRLECDEAVRYAAAVPQQPQPLWPALLRWSAAAAVIAALMVPALRMGGMLPKQEAPLLMAEAKGDTSDTSLSRNSRFSRDSSFSRDSRLSRNSSLSRDSSFSRFSSPTVAAVSASGECVDSVAAPVQEIIEVTSLIAFAEEAVEEPADTLLSLSLIAYESDDWGDRLLALNEATHESLSHSFGGRLAIRLLPDNRQLEQHVVEPLRERMDNLKNKRKQ